MAFGSEFQRLGGRALRSVWLGGQEVSISKAVGVGESVLMEEFRRVGWGQVMEGFVGHEEFEMDSVGDEEPVELREDGGDVVMGLRVGEPAGSRVLDELELTEDF